MGDVEVEVVRSEHRFVAIRPEWDSLLQRAVVHSPFLRHDWLRVCWQRHRDRGGGSPSIIVLRDAGRAVLIAPFLAQPRLLVLRNLYFLDSLTPQYNDLLVEDSAEAAHYVEHLARFLQKQWRVRRMRLNYLRSDSALDAAIRPCRQRVLQTYAAPYIELHHFRDWEHYFESRSANLRQTHRRALRRLEKKGVMPRFVEKSDVAREVRWLFARKREWVAQRAPGSTWLSASGTEELFVQAACDGYDSGWTWLTVLTTGTDTVAALLAFREHGTLYFSKTAYDPAWAGLSPGRTLLLHNVERALQHRLRKFDLMLGKGFGKERLADTSAVVTSRKIWLHEKA
jgi:CelD/BcsL family acetyltransferase involved in cellulose biosynthesis